jgi:predicted acyl esterase
MLVRRPGAPFESRGDEQWPLKDTRWVTFHLHPDGALRAEQPVQHAAAVSYQALGDGLTFITEPLAEDCHVIGPSSARLRMSSSTSDADLFLVLRLFTSDLQEVTYAGSNDPHTPMSHGWLRASMRKLDPNRCLPYRPYHSMDMPQPLTPGVPYDLDIEIFPTCFVAPAGYRIALSIRGKDYEYPGDLSAMTAAIGQPFTGVGPFRHTCPEDRPSALFDNQVTVHFDPADPPVLLLPIVPAG